MRSDSLTFERFPALKVRLETIEVVLRCPFSLSRTYTFVFAIGILHQQSDDLIPSAASFLHQMNGGGGGGGGRRWNRSNLRVRIRWEMTSVCRDDRCRSRIRRKFVRDTAAVLLNSSEMVMIADQSSGSSGRRRLLLSGLTNVSALMLNQCCLRHGDLSHRCPTFEKFTECPLLLVQDLGRRRCRLLGSRREQGANIRFDNIRF